MFRHDGPRSKTWKVWSVEFFRELYIPITALN